MLLTHLQGNRDGFQRKNPLWVQPDKRALGGLTLVLTCKSSHCAGIPWQPLLSQGTWPWVSLSSCTPPGSPRTTEPQVQWLWTGQGARGQGRGTAHTHLDLLDQRTAWGRGKASCLRYCRWKEAFWDTATHLRKSTPRAAFGGEKLEAWGSSAHWNTDCPRESQVMHLSQSPPHFVPPLLTAHIFSSFFLMLTCLFSLSNLPCHRVHWFFRVHGHS